MRSVDGHQATLPPADYAAVAYDYDLLVIGSGPGGQKAAIQAAKLGRRVAVVDRREMVGGVCTNTGTIPSKTLREAVVYLTGMSQRGIYGQSYRVKDDITATTSSGGRSTWSSARWTSSATSWPETTSCS